MSAEPLRPVLVACADCSIHSLCLPQGISQAELARLEDIVRRPRPVAAGHHFYRPGDPFRSLYVVRSGSVKTYLPARDGLEQVTGFHLPGEIVGLDGIAAEVHDCAAQALERTSVCELPFDRLEELAEDMRGLGKRLLHILGREIHHDQQMLAVLGKPSAEQRLAAMLLSFSARLKARGFSERDIQLSMSRHDIGSYLGLAVETVSRVLSRFRRHGLLRVEHRRVHIEDLPALRALAGASAAP